MKVKELIKWLKQFDDDSIVGIYDIGMDSGEWEPIANDNYLVLGKRVEQLDRLEVRNAKK